MQHPQAFDIQPTTKQTPLQPFRSDASCFSPLADKTSVPPNCSRCGGPAIGGVFTELDSGYPIGQVTGTVEFTCACAGKQVYSINTDNIGQWLLFRQLSPGVFRVKKKTADQRIKEIAQADASRRPY